MNSRKRSEKLTIWILENDFPGRTRTRFPPTIQGDGCFLFCYPAWDSTPCFNSAWLRLTVESYTNPELETGKSSIMTLYQGSLPLGKPIVSLKLNLQKCWPKTTLPSFRFILFQSFINHFDFEKNIYGFYLIIII